MNILITGVSKGLGYIVAKNCIKKGWKVFGVSRSKNENIINLLENHSQYFSWYRIDLSSTDDLKTHF